MSSRTGTSFFIRCLTFQLLDPTAPETEGATDVYQPDRVRHAPQGIQTSQFVLSGHRGRLLVDSVRGRSSQHPGLRRQTRKPDQYFGSAELDPAGAEPNSGQSA